MNQMKGNSPNSSHPERLTRDGKPRHLVDTLVFGSLNTKLRIGRSQIMRGEKSTHVGMFTLRPSQCYSQAQTQLQHPKYKLGWWQCQCISWAQSHLQSNFICHATKAAETRLTLNSKRWAERDGSLSGEKPRVQQHSCWLWELFWGQPQCLSSFLGKWLKLQEATDANIS